MKLQTSLLALLVVAVAFAGCADDADNGDGTPTTSTPATTPATTTPAATTPAGTTPATTTPAATTPVTTTPATTTPATPTSGGNPANNASITRVVVLSAPDRVAANATAEVCFLVEGSGSIPHVAVHWDTASHPNAGAFSEYVGGAAYPGGGAASPRATLPGVFCSNLTAPASGTLYYRAHALIPREPPGVLSLEHRLEAGPAPTTGIRFVSDIPEAAPANTNVTLCWAVEGATGTVPHTAVHFDTASHPNATSFTAYAGGATYPGNRSAAEGNYTLPGPFCSNLRTPASGALHFRAHVLGGTGFAAPGQLSVERSIAVAPRVHFVGELLATAPAGSKVDVCWRVEGSGVSPHVAVHFDTASHPSATSFTEYAGGAAYAGNGTAAAASQTLPGPFCTQLTMPATGALYFRAHGVYPGVGLPGELSGERSIRVA